MGGGGQSGGVSFPEHVEAVHKTWVGSNSDLIHESIVDVMNNALGQGGNPWADITLTSPNAKFQEVDERYDTYETAVDGLDNEADWESIVDTAVAKIDEAGVLEEVDMSNVASAAQSATGSNLDDAVTQALEAVNGDIIDSIVKQFEKRSAKQKARSLNRFNSTMADINAVQSSAYLFGIAMIEGEHLQRVDEFQSRLSLRTFEKGLDFYAQNYAQELTSRLRAEILGKSDRDDLIIRSAAMMSSMLAQNTNFIQSSAQLKSDIERIDVLATREHELSEGELNHRFAQWDFEVFSHGMQVLGGMGGGSIIPPRPSKLGSAVGGALSGAAKGLEAGAAIGAAGGPITALGGAGIGAALGAAASLF